MQFTDSEVQVLKNFAAALVSISGGSTNEVKGLVPPPKSRQRNIFVKGESGQAWYESYYNPDTGKYASKPFGENGMALYGNLKNLLIYYKNYNDGYGKEGDYKLVITVEADFTYRIEMGLFTVSAMSLVDRLRRITDINEPIYILPKTSEDKKTLVFFDVWDAHGDLVLTPTDAFNMEKWLSCCTDAINGILHKLNLPAISDEIVNAVKSHTASNSKPSDPPVFEAKVRSITPPKPASNVLDLTEYKERLNALVAKMKQEKIANPKNVIIDLCRHNFHAETVYDLMPSQYEQMIQLVEDFIANVVKERTNPSFFDIPEF